VRGDYERETYVVQPHDTLYSIAWRHDLDYQALARWNGIGPDYRISVGQILTLRPATPSPATPSAAARSPAALAKPAPGAAPQPSPEGSTSARWAWPTTYLQAPHAVTGGGVLLEGVLGQPVRAACNGRIVYVGSGIRGYGNLIIIKHTESLLSAYAHNRDVLVREGQQVSAGQTIARMGEGPNQIAALYFDIRENGKPTDPMRYLNAPN
jgi:lipoprotein NlpD